MALLNALLHYDTLRHHIYYDYYFFYPKLFKSNVFLSYSQTDK